jgi:hypothetical protein
MMKNVMNSIKICVAVTVIGVFCMQCNSSTGSNFSTPVLSSPSNAELEVSTCPLLSWDVVSGATNYHVEVASDTTFAKSVYNDSTLVTNTTTLSAGLKANSVYYWRVRAKNATGTTSWSSPWRFTTFSGPLELLYPRGGAGVTYKVGDIVTIKWTIHDLNQVNAIVMAYSLDSGVSWPSRQIINVTTTYPDTTSLWVIDSNCVSTKFRLKVYQYGEQGSLYNKSAVFTITK